MGFMLGFCIAVSIARGKLSQKCESCFNTVAPNSFASSALYIWSPLDAPFGRGTKTARLPMDEISNTLVAPALDSTISQAV